MPHSIKSFWDIKSNGYRFIIILKRWSQSMWDIRLEIATRTWWSETILVDWWSESKWCVSKWPDNLILISDSKTYDMIEVMAIGRKFTGSEGSPFLETGWTTVCFQGEGKILDISYRRNSLHRIGASSQEQFLNKISRMPSGPWAFMTSRTARADWTCR